MICQPIAKSKQRWYDMIVFAGFNLGLSLLLLMAGATIPYVFVFMLVAYFIGSLL
jgi:hypothetical protein